MPSLQKSLGLTHGVALYVGSVLGTGVLVLPAIAVKTAGPASLLAWLALILLSLPMALAYAALSVQRATAGRKFPMTASAVRKRRRRRCGCRVRASRWGRRMADDRLLRRRDRWLTGAAINADANAAQWTARGCVGQKALCAREK